MDDILNERKKLEKEKSEFKKEKDADLLRIKQLQDSYDQKKRLFDMQWKLLEHELLKLADEKERFRKEKAFYREVKNFESQSEKTQQAKMVPKMFFVGISDEKTLKKRYKDLIKIFHPDNSGGDITAMQAINREFDKLKKIYIK